MRDEAIAMARRVGDRQGLALMLSRSYWLRGPTPFRDILDMLAEGRDLAQQLGDIEIGAEAIQWRIASLIAIGDLTGRPGGAGARCSTWPDACASRSRCTWPSSTPRRSRSATGACARRRRRPSGRGSGAGCLAGRDPSSVYGIQMFGIRREQGRLAELAPAVRALAASDRAAAWRPGPGGADGRARDAPGGARRARPGPRRRPRHAAPGALAGVAHLPRRRVLDRRRCRDGAGWSTPSSCRTPGAA